MWFVSKWFQGGLGFRGNWFDRSTSLSTGANSLAPDLDVWVVKLTLTPKAGGSAVSYSFTRDYYVTGQIYSSSPETYPLLAADPQIKRSIGVWAADRQDVSIQLFGKTDFLARGYSLEDLFQTYELHNAEITVYYYPKPTGGQSTHTDTDNTRAKLRAVAASYEESSGILTITARDVWFKDKEISRKLEAADFPNLDPDWDGEYGPIVFGQSTTVGKGVVIDAPVVEINSAATEPRNAYAFAGWNFESGVCAPKAIDRYLLENQNKVQVTDNWVDGLINSTNRAGEDVFTPASDPANWPRDLGRYSRGIIYSPASGSGRILQEVRATLTKPAYDRCADIIDGQHFYNASNPDFLSRGNKDFTVSIWVNFDTLSDGSSYRTICAQGDAANGTLEWILYFPTGDNHVNFGISSDGVNITSTVAWSSTASTGTWYNIVGQHNSATHAIGIYVNNGTVVTASTTGTKTIASSGTPGLSRNSKDIVTGTTTTAHGMHVGDYITITGTGDSSYETSGTSTKEVLEVPSSTTWKHRDAGASGSTGGGTVVWVNAPRNSRAGDDPDLGRVSTKGAFHIGSNIVGYPGFDGKAYLFQYWNRLITGVEVSSLYNSGTPIFTKDISDSVAQDMRISAELNEPYGIRKDNKGSADLSEGTNNAALSKTISYNYCTAKALTFNNEKGQLACEIYLAETTDSGATYSIKGSSLRKIVVDVATGVSTAGASTYFFVDPPLVLDPLGTYLIVITWSNQSNTYYILSWYDSHAGSNHYALDLTPNPSGQTDKNWKKQTDVRLDLVLYFASGGSLGTATTTTGRSYSRMTFTRSATFFAPGHEVDPTTDLNIKLGMKGIKDNGSGTYTGSASAVIENPSDIVRFTLMSSEFGLSLGSSSVDTASLDSVRSALSALGISHKIVINSQTYAEEFILNVCRQARIIFYKTRQGKLALKFPTTARDAINYTFSEADHRGDFILEAVKDNDYSQIVNYCRQYYAPDTLNVSTDPSVLRRADQEKLSGKLEITNLTATSGSTYRVDQAIASDALYGRREMTDPLNYFDNANSGAIKIQNYYFDRYGTLQKRFQIKIPMRDWYALIDVFSNLRAQHTGIADVNGTSLDGSAHGSGTGLTVYQEGIPSIVWSGGQLEGQVLEVTEEGPWLTVVCETTPVF